MLGRAILPLIMRNIQNERIKVYQQNSEFYQSRLVKLFNTKDFKIITGYLDSGKTLVEVGHEYHVSKERVRQIVAKALFKVVRIYQANKGVIQTFEEDTTLEKIVKSTGSFIELEIKRRYKDLVAENTLLKLKVKQLKANSTYELSQSLPMIEDQGAKGYLLEDIKKNLGEGFIKENITL